jgi:hypothetical protein
VMGRASADSGSKHFGIGCLFVCVGKHACLFERAYPVGIWSCIIRTGLQCACFSVFQWILQYNTIKKEAECSEIHEEGSSCALDQ